MRRREFIKALAGSGAVWPLVARAQQSTPQVAFIRDGSAEGNARLAAGFRKGLNEAGYVEGQNVKVEYHAALPKRWCRLLDFCAGFGSGNETSRDHYTARRDDQRTSHPEQSQPYEVYVERGIAPDVVDALAKRGHKIVPTYPHTSANSIGMTAYRYVGAADRRTRGSLAAGF